MKQEIKLGDKVKDTITQFAGTVVAITTYLHGNTRIGIQSSELKDGVPTDLAWFDESRFVVVE